MSVLILEDAAFCRIASFAAAHHLLGGRSAEAFANDLRAGNIEAFEARYGSGSEIIHPLRFEEMGEVDPLEVAGDVAAYIYNVQPEPDEARHLLLRSIRRLTYALVTAPPLDRNPRLP